MKRVLLVLGALLALHAPVNAQTILRCRTSGGAAVDCSAPIGNSYVNWASPSAIGGTTATTIRGTTITATTQFSGSGAGLTNVPAASVVGSLSGVTVDCASNTCQNIANAALVNSSITVTAGTGLGGGGGVSLGGTVALSVLYGTTAGTATQGNDVRLPPAPSGAGGTYYDTGAAIARLAAGTANYLYQANGAAAPSWVSTLTGITISCSSNTCSNIALGSAVTGILGEANGGFGADISGIGTGIIVRSAANTPVARLLTAPAAGITIANPGGIAGSPTFALANDLAAVEALAGTGIAVRTATDTWVQRAVTAGTGISVTNGDGVAGAPTVAIDATVATLTGSQILTNKTLDCANNTCTVRLGSDVSGVAPVANGGTNSSTALSNNRAIVSSGGKLVETASACGAGTVLIGGSPPDCGSWITSVSGVSTLGATYTISADNGAFEDTGLSVTLPSAGTYLIWYTARTNISASGTAGAFVEVELYNSTDAGAIANSEEIGAYASTLSTSYYGVPHLTAAATFAASKVIKLYAKSVAPGTTTIRTVNSDTNGRTNMGYLKIAP